jgi:hypothetical protein
VSHYRLLSGACIAIASLNDSLRNPHSIEDEEHAQLSVYLNFDQTDAFERNKTSSNITMSVFPILLT